MPSLSTSSLSMVVSSFQELYSINLENTLPSIFKRFYFLTLFLLTPGAIWVPSCYPFPTLILPNGNTIEKNTAVIPDQPAWVPSPLKVNLLLFKGNYSLWGRQINFCALTVTQKIQCCHCYNLTHPTLEFKVPPWFFLVSCFL